MKSSVNKILAVAVVLLLLVNIALLIFIWKGKEKQEPKRQPGNGPFEAMVKELNMDEQQKNEYKKLRDAHFATVRPLFDSIRQIRSSFFRMVKDSTANEDSLTLYSKRIAEKQAIVDKLTFEHFKKVRTLFSGDQQAKFDEFMQKMMQRRRDSASRR
jgi:hypothetical protein